MVDCTPLWLALMQCAFKLNVCNSYVQIGFLPKWCVIFVHRAPRWHERSKILSVLNSKPHLSMACLQDSSPFAWWWCSQLEDIHNRVMVHACVYDELRLQPPPKKEGETPVRILAWGARVEMQPSGVVDTQRKGSRKRRWSWWLQLTSRNFQDFLPSLSTWASCGDELSDSCAPPQCLRCR